MKPLDVSMNYNETLAWHPYISHNAKRPGYPSVWLPQPEDDDLGRAGQERRHEEIPGY